MSGVVSQVFAPIEALFNPPSLGAPAPAPAPPIPPPVVASAAPQVAQNPTVQPSSLAADPAVEEARVKALKIVANAKGRSATLLTGGEGDKSKAPVQRKTLLGE